jgi:signal peptide peptidase SppA
VSLKYTHILRYVAETPWAILQSKFSEMMGALAYRAAGHTFTAAEIRARIGDDDAGPARASKRGAIAVIPIHGVIAHRMGSMDDTSGGTSCERIGAMLKAVMADDGIGTVILDVDSPGGTVTGMSELAADVFAARESKKIIAVVNGMMASAAYCIGSQAHEIVSIPSGVSGSIGVFSAHEDMSAALEKEGIKITLISAGKFKTEGNPFEPLSDEAREHMQGRVDAAYQQFVKDVARGRGVAVSAVKGGYGQGRALDAKAAKEAGLVDRIATMDEVIGKLVGRKAGAGMRAVFETAPLVAGAPVPEFPTEIAAAIKRAEADLTAALALPQADGDDGEADRYRRLRLL